MPSSFEHARFEQRTPIKIGWAVPVSPARVKMAKIGIQLWHRPKVILRENRSCTTARLDSVLRCMFSSIFLRVEVDIPLRCYFKLSRRMHLLKAPAVFNRCLNSKVTDKASATPCVRIVPLIPVDACIQSALPCVARWRGSHLQGLASCNPRMSGP